MKKLAKFAAIPLAIVGLLLALYYIGTRANLDPNHSAGDIIDELNGVAIYFNGGVNEVHGRNLGPAGYNIGLRHQCVEFVKRYYLERFNHQMPDQYGHAKSFFNLVVADGALNEKRGLLQYKNGSATPPLPEDIIVFGPSVFNPYGHVAVISEVNPHTVVVAQQNAGPFSSSREAFPFISNGSGYYIGNNRVLGWLRMPSKSNNSFKADGLQPRP